MAPKIRPTASARKYATFVKLPFISERQCYQLRRLLRATDMAQTVRLIFTTERSLEWQFRPTRELPNCPSICAACATASVKGTCFRKHVVYIIRCGMCNASYIGQTDRTIRTRILEHIGHNSSAVHAHMATHGPDNSSNFRWSILASHPDNEARQAIEAVLISRHSHLMNGCNGIHILPFLLSAPSHTSPL
jgi:hypothetical protein